MKTTLLAVFCLLLSTPILASEKSTRSIADVEFANTIDMKGAQKQLTLNGLGVRYKFFFKIYATALYVQEVSQDAAKVITQPGAKRVVMHVLYDELAQEKLSAAWEEGFKDNLEAAEYEQLKPQIEQFKALFPMLVAGDRVLLDYIPGEGTRVRLQNEDKGIIAGEAFYPALLKIWLGEEPVTEELKDALLGIL